MSEARGVDWDEVVDSLHGVSNVMTVRAHYPAGHPAIERAGRVAADSLARALAKAPEVVVALLDGELVVCERPMPELRERLASLADAMTRHELECFIVQRGVTANECATLGRFLAAATSGEDLQRMREQTQAELAHVLLRYAELKTRAMLDDVMRAMAARTPLARGDVAKVAQRIVEACHTRTFRLEQRSVADHDDLTTHTANVAAMTAAMVIEAGHSDDVCIDVSCPNRVWPSRSARCSTTTPSPGRARCSSSAARRCGCRRRSSTTAVSTDVATRQRNHPTHPTRTCG
jgi:hypothetical protein